MRMHFPDEYIEHWGEIYRANRGLHQNWTFIEFLQAPEAVLTWWAHHLPKIQRSILRPDIEYLGALPLLPEQEGVAARIAREWDVDDAIAEIEEELAVPEAHVRDGRHIEPLRHRCRPNQYTLRRIV